MATGTDPYPVTPKGLDPYSTAFPDEVNPSPKPVEYAKAASGGARIAGRPIRLVDAPLFSLRVEDLMALAHQTSVMDTEFDRLTPAILENVGLCLVSPYASDRQLSNCLRLHYDPHSGYTTSHMIARLGPVIAQIEVLVPTLPTFVLELQGADEHILVYGFAIDDTTSHRLLVCACDAAMLVSVKEVEYHLRDGFLLLGPRGLIHPCDSTKLHLPPRQPPVPADDAAIDLTDDDAKCIIAAVRLGLPMPTLRNGVTIAHDRATNQLWARVNDANYVGVGWDAKVNELPL